MSTAARDWLDRIHALKLDRPVKIMNVCGGHERSITMAGLRGALPPAIELIPGPGCPVCICPEEDIHQAIQLALHEDITLVTYGDMLRVPANVAKGEVRSLEQAKAAGADIRPIASPLEAAALARREPGRTFVFFAVGFETTTAPLAALICEGLPENLSAAGVVPADVAGGGAAAGVGQARFRCAGGAGTRRDGDGAAGVAVRRRGSRHPGGDRRLHQREPAGGDVFGAAADPRRAGVPR